MCFSPVGSTLRVRSRKFPAIVNCTSIDWFHEWPEEALVSVSSRFLSDIELITVSKIICSILKIYFSSYSSLPPPLSSLSSLPPSSQPEVRESVSKFMAFVHGSVNEMSKFYLANEKRYNYTTPKSFLELVSPCMHSVLINMHSLLVNMHSLLVNMHSLLVNMHSVLINMHSVLVNMHSLLMNMHSLLITCTVY